MAAEDSFFLGIGGRCGIQQSGKRGGLRYSRELDVRRMCDEKPQIPPPPLLSGRSPLLQRPEERKGGDTHLHFIIIYPRFPARRILWELDIIIFRGMRRRGGKRGGGGGRGRNSPEEKDGGWGGNLMSPEEEEEECGPKHLFSG